MNTLFYLLIALLLPRFALAEDQIVLCEEVEISHSYLRSVRIENSDDFEIIQKSKYSHILKAKNKEKSETQISFDKGSMNLDFMVFQDCEDSQVTKHFDLDAY